jgi:hypothetical protein
VRVTDDTTITIYEPARAVDVVHRVPVLVVGGGPSGLAAAIAAARAGAEVSLLERFGCFGGNLTVVGVEGLAWYRHEATVEAGGIGREFELTYMNLVHLAGCDGTDPDSLTRFEMEGRRQALLAIEALRRYTPGCRTARLRNFGMTIGIRDTRKIDAVYNMTEQDVRGEARFGDSIGIYPEFIDGYGVLILPTTGRYLHIPFRALLPRGVRNLLVAGRAIGGDRIAHAATRNMACCAVTGQAAGIAAALSVRTGRPFHELDAGLVQAELNRQGVRHQ